MAKTWILITDIEYRLGLDKRESLGNPENLMSELQEAVMFILSFSAGLVRSVVAKFSLKTWNITKTTSGNIMYFKRIAPTVFLQVITGNEYNYSCCKIFT